MRQLYEFEEQIEDLSHGLEPMTRSLWKYRRQVTIEQLGNALQQATESTDDSQHKVLSAFLKQVNSSRQQSVRSQGPVSQPFNVHNPVGRKKNPHTCRKEKGL